MATPENKSPDSAKAQQSGSPVVVIKGVHKPASDGVDVSRQSSSISKIPQAVATSGQAKNRPLPDQMLPPAQKEISQQSLDGVLEDSKDNSTTATTSPTYTPTPPFTPSWPTSPRLKSPPPGTARAPFVRRENGEPTQSNTAKRLATVSAPELAAAMLLPDSHRDQLQAQSSSSLRVPPRNTGGSTSGLETVEESSVPGTPSIVQRDDPIKGAKSEQISMHSKDEPAPQDPVNDNRVAQVQRADNESKPRATSASRPPTSLAKRSYTSLKGAKKQAAEPLRTMTVETETVTSMPQLLGERGRDGNSVRTKTSTETIRPKKEKKKSARKAPSLHGGAGTTRADIFEAKVASAVDEVDTSDSEETFVYESNPPDTRGARHHSRTPSATSLASAVEQFGRNKHGIRSGSNAISGKKSMKFSNSGYRDPEDQDASRNGSRNGSSTPRPHHIGRYGRNGHASLFDNESPFANSGKPLSPRVSTSNMTRGSPGGSKPNSPRVTNGRPLGSPRKYGGTAYNNDEDVADDERAPLLGSVRVSKSRQARRPHSRDIRSMDTKKSDAPRTWSKFGMCGLTLILTFLVCVAAATFVVTLNRPLVDVEIRRIQNVLASEQEIMLDLDVRAVNPNLFAITVNDLDVNLFAVSPYAGTNRHWQSNPHKLRKGSAERRWVGDGPDKLGWFWPDPAKPHDGVDEGTDPDDDSGTQKLLLGSVIHFDSPLTFDAAPIRRNPSSSMGEIRLAKPGNATSPGGSERWERVVQHEFDLIVRGVIQYTLPLSSKIHSASVSGRRTIFPDSEDKMLIVGRSLT